MQRYFIELAYKGTAYSGFQKQPGAATIQTEVEKALHILTRKNIELTGSSRTDAGVHALQNYFHFEVNFDVVVHQFVYRLNAILPPDITVKNLHPVQPDAHCRFSALARSYEYHIYRKKNPFLADRAYFFPYEVNLTTLNEAALLLLSYTDYTSFSKRNTQVKTFHCTIQKASWKIEKEELIFSVTANRFLRGMVRGLTGTMLKAGRGNVSIADFRNIIEAKDCRKADFSVPPQGLFLTHVIYPDSVWKSNSEST